MSPDYTAAFETCLIDLFELYDREPPSAAVLRLWWSALEPYPWSIVEHALLAHAAGCKFAPKPADIVERLVSADGRPSPDEAWSIAIQADDEDATVVWTAEIAEAFAVARPVLAVGDRIGARRTFLAAYARAIEAARDRLEPARWSVSLGHDPQQRRGTIERAVARGLLPPAQARHWLPHLPEQGIETPTSGLLADNIHQLPDEGQRNARRFIAIVRAALVKADADDRVVQATEATERQRFDKRRAEALEAIEARERRRESQAAASNQASRHRDDA